MTLRREPPREGLMTLNYNESLRNARILARAGDSLRIALEDSDDAVELRLCDGVWMSEESIPVSFEFLEAPEIPLVSGERGRCSSTGGAA